MAKVLKERKNKGRIKNKCLSVVYIKKQNKEKIYFLIVCQYILKNKIKKE